MLVSQEDVGHFEDLSLFPSLPSLPSFPSFPFFFLTNKLFGGNIMVIGHIQVFSWTNLSSNIYHYKLALIPRLRDYSRNTILPFYSNEYLN